MLIIPRISDKNLFSYSCYSLFFLCILCVKNASLKKVSFTNRQRIAVQTAYQLDRREFGELGLHCGSYLQFVKLDLKFKILNCDVRPDNSH
jgi:hypothetical protein